MLSAAADDAASALVVHEVSVTVRGARLLERVSLALVPGELVALVGPNGAGKSTLLGVLCGDRRPTRGEVALDGVALAAWTPAGLARRRAVLPQSSALAFGFTALEVARLGCAAAGPRRRHPRRPHDDDDRARAALATVGVADLADRLYPTLSGGEQKRVQLARVLAQLDLDGTGPPRYLFLDEPTASLDLARQHELLRLAQAVAHAGVAVVVVLHELDLAARYADRVLVLGGGRLVADGPPAEALTPTRVAATFGVAVTLLEHDARQHLVVLGTTHDPDAVITPPRA